MQATKATQEAANFCSTYFIKKGFGGRYSSNTG